MQDLPPEVIEAMQAPTELAKGEIERLRVELIRRRDESVRARRESGIEEVWAAAEDAYIGVDDANRSEFAGAKWAKPTSIQGPLTSNLPTRQTGEVKSTVFVPLTSRYVDAGAAKVGEILLPVDDKAFSFDATPVPELLEAAKSVQQVFKNGIGLERPARPEEVQQLPGAAPSVGAPSVALPSAGAPAASGTQQLVPLTVKDLAEENMQRAQEAAKKAEKRIYDWMVEAQYPAEVRKVIFDAARIGVGVLYGPFPERRVHKMVKGGALAIEEVIVPSFQWVDPWNIYPDRACGENVHGGDGIFELRHLSPKELKKLKRTPGYIKAAIDAVLEMPPKGEVQTDQAPSRDPLRDRHRYAAWIYHGEIPRAALKAIDAKLDDGKQGDTVHAICTIVEDTVIQAVIAPLESGELPYHAVPWRRRPGHWAGVGIGEQVQTAQRMINAATRAMLNNAGKSAGSITVIDRGSIQPLDGIWNLGPDKFFYKTADSTVDDVRKAFAFFQVPNTTPQLMSVIQYALQMAEESTSIPLVTQGQSGATTPETFGATQLQNNNANQLLRSIGYTFDDYLTEPVVRQSYEWLLLDEDVPDEEKGDWCINAHGSTAFVERAIQDQTIQAMGAFVKDPAYGTNPKKWFAEFMRTKHLNPTVFQYTAEEQAKIDAQGTPPPPQVQVAQIKAADAEKQRAADLQEAQVAAGAVQSAAQIRGETTLQAAEKKAETEAMRIKRDTDRDTVYVQAETRRTDNEYAARMRELEVRRELAILDYANKRELKLEDVKKGLADTAMRLRTQEKLAGVAHTVDMSEAERDRAVDIHKHNSSGAGGGEAIKPAAEPPGKAPNGKGFTR